MELPLVAIVGRPNVGKSSLFNRLVGRREAIVSDIPGTTRDRVIGDVSRMDQSFTLVDTGGLELSPDDPVKLRVKDQVETAVSQADLIIFMVDADIGLSPMDFDVAEWMRPFGKPVVLAMNKSDNDTRAMSGSEFHALGMGSVFPISVYHNIGVEDLVIHILSLLPKQSANETPDIMRLAILGRVNVGKSMLANAILGEERSIVNEMAGTTRDSIDSPFEWDGNPGVIIDTAGMRRRGSIKPGIERYSVLRTINSAHRSNITLVVLDGTEKAFAQDTHIAGMVWGSYKGVILVVNKWDLVSSNNGLEKELYIQQVRSRFQFMPYAPIMFTSALKRQGIDDLLSIVVEVYAERRRRVFASDLYNAVMDAIAMHPPPYNQNKPFKVHSIRQTGVNPMEITFDVNDTSVLHFSYKRYLESRIRTALELRHTRAKLVFRRRKK